MQLSPREKDKLLVAMAAHRRTAPARARRQAQLPRGGRADHRLRRRGRARRPLGRRADGGGRARPSPRPGHGRHRRDDPRRPGRGHLPGRHEARHRAPPDPRRDRRARCPARSRRRPATSTSTRAARRSRSSREHRRPADPGRLALPFLRDEPGARFERDRRAACASTSRPAPRCASSPGRSREVRLIPLAGNRSVYGFRQADHGRL